MICIDYVCDSCIHRRPNTDGGEWACDAFPDGIPNALVFKSNPAKLKECNNGIGYEKKAEDVPRR